MRTTLRPFAGPLFLLTLIGLAAAPLHAVEPEAAALAERGFAELENEKPESAEAVYRQLVELLPKDPLPRANLAIALLRQQKLPEALETINQALELNPGRPDLIAIRGEIKQWSGDLEGAMVDLETAAESATKDPETQYAAYQAASTLRTEAADAVAWKVLERLRDLRPENVVVLLQLAQRSIARGDRATATGAILRVGELLWQAPPIATRAYDKVVEALAGDDLSEARVPAVRLENVLKVSPMFRESLRELKTGIQGIPVRRFLMQPLATDFGPPVDVTFTVHSLDDSGTSGQSLAVADFDGDQSPDVARVSAGGRLEIRLASKRWAPGAERLDAGKAATLLATDLDNDGDSDLLASGASGSRLFVNAGNGTFARFAGDLGLAGIKAQSLEVIDFDIEGDLDLAVAGPQGVDLWRNSLEGDLATVGSNALPELPKGAAHAIAVSDMDADGDLDVLVGHERGLLWLDNLRQGEFVDRSARAGLEAAGEVRAVAAADLDNDGDSEAIAAGDGVHVWRNLGGRLLPWPLPGLPSDGSFDVLRVADLNNDGRKDLAVAGESGLLLLLADLNGGFKAQSVKIDSRITALNTADLDQDGDLDLLVGTADSLLWLEGRGAEKQHWLSLRLRGLDKGSSKNNSLGVGSLIEVRVGTAYQRYEARGDVLHIGLGQAAEADVVRVVWTNGVPQNRLDLAGDRTVVEEQLLKGSCPFVYVWNGERFDFGTDLLWGAPIGLPAAPGVWVGSDPTEIVRLDGLVVDGDRYRLRLTEELWEAAFFDRVRLWVVDHPADVEVASSLRIVPGQSTPEEVRGSRHLRPMAAAWDGRGTMVTELVAERDDVYADGYGASPYQGVAKPWTFTVDLGEAPARSIRLHLDGWIFPSDASLNLAVAQRADYPYLAPRLEVETADGSWQVLMDDFGFPAGKTKTMVVDTPPLPEGASRLRLVTSLWLHWDRMAWTVDPADDAPEIVAQLDPEVADLRFRGFSAPRREAPNAPHGFDYQRVRQDSPWLPFPGRYTRFGDVRPLLTATDDLSVILAPGDEIDLQFDASLLMPPREGFTRTLFLESHGWDKDADRNTGEGLRMEPLPFHAMSGYPYGDDEAFPDTPAHRRYVEEWLTREITDEPRLEVARDVEN